MGPVHFWESGMWIFPTIGLTVFFIGMLIALYLIFRRGGLGSNIKLSENPPSETALDILKRRYAKGDINEEEFHRMKTNL